MHYSTGISTHLYSGCEVTKFLIHVAVVMALPAARALIKLRYWPMVQAVSASISSAPRYCLTSAIKPTNSSPCWQQNHSHQGKKLITTCWKKRKSPWRQVYKILSWPCWYIEYILLPKLKSLLYNTGILTILYWPHMYIQVHSKSLWETSLVHKHKLWQLENTVLTLPLMISSTVMSLTSSPLSHSRLKRSQRNHSFSSSTALRFWQFFMFSSTCQVTILVSEQNIITGRGVVKSHTINIPRCTTRERGNFRRK